jgi:predicted nucleotidyltransferase
MLRHVHDIEPGRQTKDVDFAVMVPDWATFAALRAALIGGGAFSERAGPATHRLRHQSGLPLDIVPFGGIERADRTIAWPPDQSTVFDCFGAREAFNATVLVLLPQAVTARVASIPALALLKVTAWQDRKYSHPGRDADDLLLYLRSYMDCGTIDRAARDHSDLFAAEDYDHEAAGACLLGRDMALLLDRPAIERLLAILLPQSDTQGPLLLAKQSGLELEKARRLIDAVCEGLTVKA